jgi:Uncharacterized protein conserved in bacteria
MKYNIKKILYLGVAFLCVGIGAVGVVLPVLPTTPFLLLASFCFAKGSERFHKWFLGTKLYKKHLESFVETRSMTKKTKICILLPATLMMSIAIYFAPNWHMQAFMGALIVFKYYYFIFRIRTVKREEKEE